MLGRDPVDDKITEENCPVLYRPPKDGEEKPHAHRVQQITRMQVRLEKTSEDGRLLDPDGSPEGHMRLSRRELESGGSALHTPTRTRFYRDKEEARDREKARGG